MNAEEFLNRYDLEKDGGIIEITFEGLVAHLEQYHYEKSQESQPAQLSDKQINEIAWSDSYGRGISYHQGMEAGMKAYRELTCGGVKQLSDGEIEQMVDRFQSQDDVSLDMVVGYDLALKEVRDRTGGGVDKEILVQFFDSVREYLHEAGHWNDDRESEEFVDIFLTQRNQQEKP